MGLPAADVTTIKLQPKTLPATFEYVGQTTAPRKSRCAHGSPASSKRSSSRKALG
jgi:hypothetical protein